MCAYAFSATLYALKKGITMLDNIVVQSIASSITKPVQCVGVSTHEKATIGTKIRFSGKPESSARVSTLIATKLHSDIIMCDLSAQVSELQGAVLVRDVLENSDYLQAHQLSAIDSFIAKYSTHEISAAREYISNNNIKIVKILM